MPAQSRQAFALQPAVGMVLLDSQKSDSVDLAESFRGIYIDAAAVATLKFNLIDGSTVATSFMQVGRVHWLSISRLWLTGSAQVGIFGVR